MILAIASGKGGTGKTTLAVNLARISDGPVHVLDCDVEEPNAHLFLGGEILRTETVNVPVPQVDQNQCDSCGKCAKFCGFNAIVSLPNRTMVFGELCHSCGGCMLVCPRQAISEVDRRIGVVELRRIGLVTLVQGRLDVGVAMAPPLVRAVKAHLDGVSTAILDAPPGTSCPVVTTLRGSDFVLLVTEPTPFGLHDLGLAVKMVRALKLPFGVAVNRVGAGDDRVHAFCAKEEIPILLEIPDDRRIAEAYSRGELLVDALPEYACLFQRLRSDLGERARSLGK